MFSNRLALSLNCKRERGPLHSSTKYLNGWQKASSNTSNTNQRKPRCTSRFLSPSISKRLLLSSIYISGNLSTSSLSYGEKRRGRSKSQRNSQSSGRVSSQLRKDYGTSLQLFQLPRMSWVRYHLKLVIFLSSSFSSAGLSLRKFTISRQNSSIAAKLVSKGSTYGDWDGQIQNSWACCRLLLTGVALGAWGDFIRGEFSISFTFCFSLEFVLKKSLMAKVRWVGVLAIPGLFMHLGELNIFSELISPLIFPSTYTCFVSIFRSGDQQSSPSGSSQVPCLYFCLGLDCSDSSDSSRMFLMSSFMLSLWLERVFSLEPERSLALSAFIVSLKSFMVMSELSIDRGFTFFFCRFERTFRHQVWMVITLPMMNRASSMYFLVMKPLNTFWILRAAAVRMARLFYGNSMLAWHPSVFTFRAGCSRNIFSLQRSSDSQGFSWMNSWKLTSEYRIDLWILVSNLLFFSFFIRPNLFSKVFPPVTSFFKTTPFSFFLGFLGFSSSRITEFILELISVLIEALLLLLILSGTSLLMWIVATLPDFRIIGFSGLVL